MKKVILMLAACGTLFSAPAQLFSPEAWTGALWGSLIGGIAGGNCHHGFSGESAAIGAGVGLLAGSIVGEVRRQNYASPYYYYGSPAPVYASPYVYYAPNAYAAPGYYYQPARPNYAVGGTLVGAASGALIGAGSHRPGEGAAIGAAAGLVLGGVAEISARRQERAYTTQAASVAAVQPQPQLQPARPGQAAASATATVQAPRHQIADAPRVPDPPTF